MVEWPAYLINLESDAMARKILLALIVAIALLSALEHGSLAKSPAGGDQVATVKQVFYVCEGGTTFTVEFSDNGDAALLTWEGEKRRLPRLISASGARYGDGQVTLWLKGDEAFIEVKGKIVRKKLPD